MRSALMRTGSVPLLSGSLKLFSFRPDSLTVGVVFTSSVNNTINNNKKKNHGIRRAMSESDVVRSACKSILSSVGSRSFPARIPEEECISYEEEDEETLAFDYGGVIRIWPEMEFPGGGFGIGKNNNNGGGGGGNGGDRGGGNGEFFSLDSYYNEMLQKNPGDPLLLRNYARFLHEVKKDVVKAEEYYGRAILASPGDGEVLCLYGKLIWEAKKDEERAKSYFHQALHASPDDCTVLGSFARFMWETGENEEKEGEEEAINKVPSPMIAAF